MIKMNCWLNGEREESFLKEYINTILVREWATITKCNGFNKIEIAFTR